MRKSKSTEVQPTAIGGQAVIEGVMMRGKKLYALAVRTPSKEIEIVKNDIHPLSEKYPILKLPILRGVIAFVESLVMGMKITTLSVEMAGLDDVEEESSKFEIWLENKLGDKLNDVLITVSVIFALALSIGLFMLLPVWLSSFIRPVIGENTWALGIIEGFVRIGIFIFYIFLISKLKDMQRVFAYHGAEHKTINCFESKEELTVENVRKHTRLHKRCGTSFLLIVMIVSMITFMFVRTDIVWVRFAMRIVLVPLIAGVSYEIIRWAGRSNSALVPIISYPGMLMQKLTTLEPDDDQIEVAIAAMNGVLESEEV